MLMTVSEDVLTVVWLPHVLVTECVCVCEESTSYYWNIVVFLSSLPHIRITWTSAADHWTCSQKHGWKLGQGLGKTMQGKQATYLSNSVSPTLSLS